MPVNPINFNCIVPPVMPRMEKNKTSLERVLGLVNDQTSQALAREHGLVIQNVSWEDTARDKNSCWGPNISDMTLRVENRNLPVIRQPNFTDKTTDISLDAFTAVVGNEKGDGTLQTFSLKEYLSNIATYVNNGELKGPILAERDDKVIHSVQACILPAEAGQDVTFNANLYNYQSYPDSPAVLTIVLSNKGASAQVIDNARGYTGQNLYFNQNGKRCSFVAERLKDVRAQQGKAVEGALNEAENANRTLRIIQIPLKVKERPVIQYQYFCEKSVKIECCSTRSALGIDDAQIRIGKEEGVFAGLGSHTIERDPRYPIRVTTQLYKVSDTGVLNRTEMEAIAAEIKKEEARGTSGSSLVIEQTKRPTEWVKV